MTEIALHMPVFATMLTNVIGRALLGVSNFFDAVAAAGRARVEIEQLGRISNSELAAPGRTRARPDRPPIATTRRLRLAGGDALV